MFISQSLGKTDPKCSCRENRLMLQTEPSPEAGCRTLYWGGCLAPGMSSFISTLEILSPRVRRNADRRLTGLAGIVLLFRIKLRNDHLTRGTPALAAVS